MTTGPLTAAVNGISRAAALTGAIAALDPVGQCWLYNRIKAGYTYSAAQVVTGRKNLVVVITASADSTPS